MVGGREGERGREGGKKRDEESTRRRLREEAGDAENVEGKKKRRERGRGREENEEETAMHTLPSRDDGRRRETTGRTETAGNSGRETEGKKRGKNAFVDCSIE